MVDLQGILGAGADGEADAMTVLRTPLEGAQDEHVERALDQFDAVFETRTLRHR